MSQKVKMEKLVTCMIMQFWLVVVASKRKYLKCIIAVQFIFLESTHFYISIYNIIYILIRMKHRQEVYKDRQKIVDKICQTFNVTSSAVPNSFDDIYSKEVDNDSGKN